MKASVFIAATLDGYIATPDGDIDFLNQHPSSNPEEDFGYYAFIETVDAIVMGRKSFEKVLSFVMETLEKLQFSWYPLTLFVTIIKTTTCVSI